MTGDAWAFPVPDDFRLAPTVVSHGSYLCPPFEWNAEDERLTRVLHVPEVGPRVVEVTEELTESVEVMRGSGGRPQPTRVRRPELRLRTPEWSPDDDARIEIEEAVVFMLALDRDLHPFHELCRAEPSLSRIADLGAGRLLRCPGLWEELGKAICAASVPWERALQSIESVARLGDSAGDRTAWPRPRHVLDAGVAGMRAAGAEESEASRIVELAERVNSGALDLGSAEAGFLSRDELAALFRSVPGLDEGAVSHLLMIYGHAHHLPLDESTVTFLRDRHFGGRTPSEEDVRARYERFGEWKALALWFDFVQEVWWPAAGVDPG